ncbi:hypothetical protein ACVDFE_23130 [Lentzea chajnantorensis]
MRLFVGAVVVACLGTGVVGVPAQAGHDPARQVLPAGDGWASSGPGTTGGAAAPAGHVHEVRTRAEASRRSRHPRRGSSRSGA